MEPEKRAMENIVHKRTLEGGRVCKKEGQSCLGLSRANKNILLICGTWIQLVKLDDMAAV